VGGAKASRAKRVGLAREARTTDALRPRLEASVGLQRVERREERGAGPVNERNAVIDRLAVEDPARRTAAAHPARAFKDGRANPTPRQFSRALEAGDTGPDHDDLR
jgi:hypothetical protein